MTDLSITATAVLANGADVDHGTAGATITAGQVVYREASSGKYKLADSNSPTAEVKAAVGIALNGASDGQPVAVARRGDITMNAVLTAGSAYYLSETPGGIQPAADLSAEDVVQLGLAKSTTVLSLRIIAPGVTLS
jgi:hypothetical protein